MSNHADYILSQIRHGRGDHLLLESAYRKAVRDNDKILMVRYWNQMKTLRLQYNYHTKKLIAQSKF